MINIFKRLNNDVNRDMSNVYIALKFYGIVFSFVFIFFGIFGVYPLFSILRQKVIFIGDLTKKNDELRFNLGELTKMRSNLENYSSQIELLNAFMPNDASVQSYMLDFIDAVSSVGYSLISFSQSSVVPEDNAIELQVNLEGNSYPVDLVNKIETLKRLTYVKSVSFVDNSSQAENRYSVIMIVVIYNLGK